MKKSITRFLMLMAVVATMGTFQSCKDTNEDLYNELQLQQIKDNDDLMEAFDKQVDNLQDQLDLYKQQLDAIKQCDCDKDQLNATLKALQDAIKALQNTDDAMAQDLANKYTELLNKLTKQGDIITNYMTSNDAAVKELEEAIKKLEDALKNVDTCKCDLQAIWDKLAELEKAAAEAKALAQDAMDRAIVADNHATEAKNAAAAAQAAADAAQAAADAAKAAADKAQATADKAVTDAAAAQAAADAAKTAADKAQQVADAAKTLADQLNTRLGVAEGKITENAEKIAQNAEKINNINVQLVTMSEKLETAYNTAVAADAQAKYNAINIEYLLNTMEAMQKTTAAIITDVETLKAKTDANTEAIEKLEDAVETLDQKLTDKVAELDQKIVEALEEAKEYADDVLTKAKQYADAQDVIVKAALVGMIDEAKQALQDQIDDLDEAIDALETKVNTNTTNIQANTIKIGQVEQAYKDADEVLQDQIDQLNDDLADLTDRVDAIEDQIDDILDRLDEVEEYLKNQVTSILVQATKNQAFGSVLTPFGVQSNVLVAYYGTAKNDVEFPTTSTANYVRTNQALTAQDWAMLNPTDIYTVNQGGTILVNDDANAGTIYLTVNPTGVDFTGLNFSLVNSMDVESGVKLGDLQECNEVLKLGFTSRSQANGFYKADAYIENPNDVQKLSFNGGALKDAVSEIAKNRLNASLSEVASDLYKVVEGVNLDANAVKCETQNGNSVYSNYNIAATAIQPLGLDFAKEFNYQTLPGLERIENLIDRAANSIKSRITSAKNEFMSSDLVNHVQNLKIKHIQLEELSDATLDKFKFSFTIDKTFSLAGKTVKFDIDKDVELDVAFTAEADLSGIKFDCPTIAVSGSGTVAEVVIPIYEDKNNNGVMDPGEAITGDGGQQVYAKYPAQSVTVTGSGSASTQIEIPNGTKVTIPVDEKVNTHIKLEDLEFTIPNDDTFTFRVNETYDKDLTDAVKDLWKGVQDQIGGVNNMLDDVNQIVTDINNQLDKINKYETTINNTIDDVAGKLQNYIDKFNNKLVALINSLNDRLQPMLLVADGTGAKKASGSKNYPTVISGNNVALFPTTYNMELLVPVAKKHVGVTNVFKGGVDAKGQDAACKAALTAANSATEMNAVLDGDDHKIEVGNLKSGFTYEIAYSVLDFKGQIATRKYYVTVK